MGTIKLTVTADITDRNGIVKADNLRVRFIPLVASVEANQEYLALTIAEFMAQGDNVPEIIARATELHKEHLAKQS